MDDHLYTLDLPTYLHCAPVYIQQYQRPTSDLPTTYQRPNYIVHQCTFSNTSDLPTTYQRPTYIVHQCTFSNTTYNLGLRHYHYATMTTTTASCQKSFLHFAKIISEQLHQRNVCLIQRQLDHRQFTNDCWTVGPPTTVRQSW